MSDERKKPGWKFWTVVVLSLPVLYIASAGPACWVSSHVDFGSSAVSVIYQPLMRCSLRYKPAAHAIRWYSKLGASARWAWVWRIDNSGYGCDWRPAPTVKSAE